ncbi:MAG: GFA family protein [Pseudomonadales bacterium]|nr:GFA family protein [Pseudomonadales bacterium]
MNVTGKCFCGHISYKAEVDPNIVAVCHCSDCQEHSGTAFGVIAGVIDEEFHLLTGKLKSFIKVAASGNHRELTFCPECGTRIYAKDAGDKPGFIGLRYGTIEQRNELTPNIQVWCKSAQPWAIIESMPKLENQS